MSVASVVCCQLEVTASGLSLAPEDNECGVPECDREASIMWRSWPSGGLLHH
jgi:hypothetical protein